jgi:hypothetical protein
MKRFSFILIAFIMIQVQIFAANYPFPYETANKFGIKPSHVSQEAMNGAIISQYEEWKVNYFRTYPAPHDNIGYIKGGVTGSIPWDWKDDFYSDAQKVWKAIHQHYNGSDPDKHDLTKEPFQLVTASEHTGYGLLVFVLMAGYDKDAKTNFDKIVNFYKLHMRDNKMMSWTASQYHPSLPFIKDEHLPFTETVTFEKPDPVTWEPITVIEAVTVTKDNKSLPLTNSASDGDMDIAYALLLADKQWGSSG